MIGILQSHPIAIYSLATSVITLTILNILIRAGMRQWKSWRILFFWSICLIAISLYFGNQSKQSKIPDEQLYFIGTITIICILSFIQGFVRRRCPECGTASVDCASAKELDRWTGSKKVKERIISGSGKNRKEKIVDKTIAVTYVKMEYRYVCKKCHTAWREEVKEEK